MRKDIEKLIKYDIENIKDKSRFNDKNVLKMIKQHGFDLNRVLYLAYKNMFTYHSNDKNDDINYTCYSIFGAKLKLTLFNASSSLSCLLKISINDNLIYDEPPF